MTKTLLAMLIALILLGGVLPGPLDGCLGAPKPHVGDLRMKSTASPEPPTALLQARPVKTAYAVRFLSAAGILQNYSAGPLFAGFGRVAAVGPHATFANLTPNLLTLGCLLTI